jgi:hypothetical protein
MILFSVNQYLSYVIRHLQLMNWDEIWIFIIIYYNGSGSFNISFENQDDSKLFWKLFDTFIDHISEKYFLTELFYIIKLFKENFLFLPTIQRLVNNAKEFFKDMIHSESHSSSSVYSFGRWLWNFTLNYLNFFREEVQKNNHTTSSLRKNKNLKKCNRIIIFAWNFRKFNTLVQNFTFYLQEDFNMQWHDNLK